MRCRRLLPPLNKQNTAVPIPGWKNTILIAPTQIWQAAEHDYCDQSPSPTNQSTNLQIRHPDQLSILKVH